MALGFARPALAEDPVLHAGPGNWAVVAGIPETTRPPDGPWQFDAGHWIGRLPQDVEALTWGRRKLAVAEAVPLPAAPAILPVSSNPFGPCVVHSLSVRYDSVVRSRRWSLVFAPEGREPEFLPLALPGRRKVGLVLRLQDAETGRAWELRPTRQGREDSKQDRPDEDPRFYAGTLEQGNLEWSLVVVPGRDGRRILQGRIMVMNPATRLFRVRVLLRTGAPGLPVLQADSPPAVVAAVNQAAVALFADLAEPRRLRAVTDEPQAAGLEFDLAVTKATGNFPSSATFSLEADAWDSDGPAAAAQEAVARLARGGGAPLPDAVVQDGLNAVAVFEPARMVVSHPGGFQDGADVLHYLMVQASRLFPDRDWAASAFACAAQDPTRQPRIEIADQSATIAVNADPDLETMLELGPNRARVVLDRIRRGTAPAVFLRALGDSPGLDHNGRALYLSDYPAVWEAGRDLPGVDLRHAEIELIAALACVLKGKGVPLLVGDAGPLAPFSTYPADALVCESDGPDEMRRQRALAGARPVLWLPPAPPTDEIADLARNLGFVRPGKMEEN